MAGYQLPPHVQLGIVDRTSINGMTPQAWAILNAMAAAAPRYGLDHLTITAGRGGGHLSHQLGTEWDLAGFGPSGKYWTPEQRVAMAQAARQAGADRFGLYSSGRSLHVGYGHPGAPGNVTWGAGGLTSGDASRRYANPVELAFSRAVYGGRPFSVSALDAADALAAGTQPSQAPTPPPVNQLGQPTGEQPMRTAARNQLGQPTGGVLDSLRQPDGSYGPQGGMLTGTPVEGPAAAPGGMLGWQTDGQGMLGRLRDSGLSDALLLGGLGLMTGQGIQGYAAGAQIASDRRKDKESRRRYDLEQQRIAQEQQALDALAAQYGLPTGLPASVEADMVTQAMKPQDTFRPMTAAERAQWGISADDPNPWGMGADGKPILPGGRAPQTTVNVDTQGQNEWAKEAGKLGAQNFFDRRTAAQDAAQSLQSTAQARELLNSGVITGFGANFKIGLGKALQQVGINFAQDEIANSEAFLASRAQEVGRIIKLFGAGTGLSDADRQYAEKAAAGQIELNETSIRRILDINERAARNVIASFNRDASQVPQSVSPYPLTVDVPSAAPPAQVQPQGGRPSQRQGPPPGVTQQEWNAMTPEERALWQ